MTGGGNGGFNVYKYHYPMSRSVQDAEGQLEGVMGSVELLNSKVISTQPIVSMDWRYVELSEIHQVSHVISPDREGLAVLACLDQSVRVYIVSKTHKY